jgi:hypothetical protein
MCICEIFFFTIPSLPLLSLFFCQSQMGKVLKHQLLGFPQFLLNFPDLENLKFLVGSKAVHIW